MTGLTWLASWEGAASWPFCLTFVRGRDEDAVLRAFGGPRNAAPVGAPIERPGMPARPVVRVGRCEGWAVALDENVPPQGTRPEVLRRVSAGTDAVAIYRDIAKLNHEFAYARGGEVIAAVTTSVPPHWRGSAPGQLRSLAEELRLAAGADADLDGLEVLLTIAERAFGLSLSETDHGRSWPAAPILPVLDDLPAPRDNQPPWRAGDAVLDLLMEHVPDDALPRVASIRASRAIAAAGLGAFPVLVSAVRKALAGGAGPVSDDDPAGLALRAGALEHPGEVTMLRFVLAGRQRDALTSDIHRHRTARVAGWREQFIADLGELDLPAGELRGAEEAARAQPARVPAVADTGPARSHVQALLDAGMDPAAIAKIGGMTPVGFDRLMGGGLSHMPGSIASRVLAIEIPPRGRG